MKRYKKVRKTIYLSTVIALLMFGFSFAMAPLYFKYCKITGINTALRIGAPVLSRNITVQFLTENNRGLAWDFYPLSNSVHVHPDETTQVFFYAKNNTQHTMTVQAIPSITPGIATAHFHKTECFCFRQQTLKAGEAIKMPLIFLIDNAIPTQINTVTLGYTLFDAAG